MEYLVRLGWRAEFVFNDLENAASFARAAFMTRTGEEAGDEIQIIIRKVEKNEEEEEEDNETD